MEAAAGAGKIARHSSTPHLLPLGRKRNVDELVVVVKAAWAIRSIGHEGFLSVCYRSQITAGRATG